MKSVIKLLNLDSEKDVRIIQNIITDYEGIIASQVLLNKKEVIIIYNDSSFDEEEFIEAIEDMGYMVT